MGDFEHAELQICNPPCSRDSWYPAYIADRMDMLRSCLDDGATVISGNSCKRDLEVFDVTIFGADFPSVLTINHIIPHAPLCRLNWTPCVQNMGGVNQTGLTMSPDEAAIFLNGVVLSGKKSPYSSYVRSPENLFSMCQGNVYYDHDPSVALYPIKSVNGCQEWNKCGYKCMVVASSAAVYCKIGALDGEPGSWTVLRASDPDDLAQIKLAINTYRTIALETAARFAHLEAPSKSGSGAGMTSEKYISEIRESIVNKNQLRVPDPDNIPADAVFRVIEFGSACSKAEEQPSPAPGARQLHPAPNPMLLQQRNVNVNVNHNYKCGLYETAPVIKNVFAAFWPSCFDMDPQATTCNLCRHQLSVRNPYLVEPFAENEWEAIEMPDPAEGVADVNDASGADESKSGGQEVPLVGVVPVSGPVWPGIGGPALRPMAGLMSSDSSGAQH